MLFIVRAYAELSTCRSFGGGGPGPIPWITMLQWAEHQGIDPDATDHLIAVLRIVDSIILTRLAAEAELRRKSGTDPNTGKKG